MNPNTLPLSLTLILLISSITFHDISAHKLLTRREAKKLLKMLFAASFLTPTGFGVVPIPIPLPVPFAVESVKPPILHPFPAYHGGFGHHGFGFHGFQYSSTPLIGEHPLKDQLIFAASEIAAEQLASNQLPSNQMLLNQLPTKQMSSNHFLTNDISQGFTTLKPIFKSSLNLANKKEDEEVIINNGLKADNDEHYKTLKVIKIKKKS